MKVYILLKKSGKIIILKILMVIIFTITIFTI